jgi:hypothetical protein
MLMKVLVSILRSRKRDTKDVIGFIHAALRPLFLIVFDVSLTSLSQPLLKRQLKQRPTIFLYVLEVLLLVEVLIPRCIIDGSLRCLMQFLRLLEQLLLNEGVIVKLPPTHLLRLFLGPQLLEVLSHQLLYQLFVQSALLLLLGWRRALFFRRLRRMVSASGCIRRKDSLSV